MNAATLPDTGARSGNTAWITVLRFLAVFQASGRRFQARDRRGTPPGFLFLVFRRCFERAGAASERKMGTEHRPDFHFSFSGGVSSERAPLPSGKWAQNTAWIFIFRFQAVFQASGRRFRAENGTRTE
jgi:hypothetical protein